MTNYIPTAFARESTAKLRGLIARYDVNQADLAILCDVSQSQFSKIIRGLRPMTLDQLAALCDALDIDVVEFVTEVEHYVSDRVLHSSPVRFVEQGDRLPTPEPWDAEHVNLDGWARAAEDRFWGPAADVRASKEDYEAAAKAKSRDRGGDDGQG